MKIYPNKVEYNPRIGKGIVKPECYIYFTDRIAGGFQSFAGKRKIF